MTAKRFCTYFDIRYLPQGLAMLESLCRYAPGAHVTVWALDATTKDAVARCGLGRGRATIRVVDHSNFGRRTAEQIWMLTPHIVCDALQYGGEVAYVDADLFFMSDIEPLYALAGDAPAAVVPHMLDKEHADRLRANGTYNVGWVRFNGHGGYKLACRWLDQCEAWRPTPEQPRFMDQLYLEDWPAHGAAVIADKRANLAPYNQWQHAEPFTPWFYHFHEFAWQVAPDAELRIRRTGYCLRDWVARDVYEPYEQRIAEWVAILVQHGHIDGGPSPC